MKRPDWTILTDPDQHDCENSAGEYWYTDNLYAKTPYGIAILEAGRPVNGASIPWYCQGLIPKSGKWNRCSGFHDIGFEDGGLWLVDLNRSAGMRFEEFTQKEIDKLYLNLMAGRKVKKWIRKAQYRMLRMFGWVTWNKYKNDRIKNKDEK